MDLIQRCMRRIQAVLCRSLGVNRLENRIRFVPDDAGSEAFHVESLEQAGGFLRHALGNVENNARLTAGSCGADQLCALFVFEAFAVEHDRARERRLRILARHAEQRRRKASITSEIPEAEQIDHEEHVRRMHHDVRRVPLAFDVRQELDERAWAIRVACVEIETGTREVAQLQIVQESVSRQAYPLPIVDVIGDSRVRVRFRDRYEVLRIAAIRTFVAIRSRLAWLCGGRWIRLF